LLTSIKQGNCQDQGSPTAFGQRHGAAHRRIVGAPARSWALRSIRDYAD